VHEIEIRSGSRVVRSTLESKFWSKQAPSVDAARPARCVGCGGAAREPGAALGVVGHGVRDRQLRGPATAEGAPAIADLIVRRYLCRRCGVVMTVVPVEVEPRRHYSRPAIALACARLGLLGETAAAVRRAVSPWATATTTGWPTLRRWAVAVRSGALFTAVRTAATTTVAIATRVAQAALGHAPPSLRGAPTLALVFAGAIAMA
jgi:hypothetical protein